ncbi:innexin inx2-like [Anoplophora glabripennis]|uniref:innexin inx2-like n=1 Tax=Anoplophora glabripennis TaxID=217634 RepID=UPI00087517E5|nr:innexin inx2-like [Anoplophora glabripennis]
MIKFLNSFKSLIKLKQVHIDNNVFKLHYKVTVILLVAFSVLLTTKEYFGDPIDCDVEERKEVIDTFCWIYGTFIVKRTLNDPHLPGLGLSVNQDPEAVTRQVYYQWVCIAFCIQAVIFYLPRYLWKMWEGGRLQFLVKDLTGPVVTPDWNSAKKETLVKYVLNGKQVHNIYTVRYSFCEFLNFINVVAQIYFMDWFITGHFSVYGIAYATYKMYRLTNPMNEVFPKITKCTYFKIGPSGTEVNRDALCILPLNVLNEKFFLVLWYWLFILLVLSFLSLVYRALFLFVPMFRVYLLRAQTRSLDKKKSEIVVNHITYGDFFVLYKIGKNVNPMLYRDLVGAIYDQIAGKESPFKKLSPPSTFDEV